MARNLEEGGGGGSGGGGEARLFVAALVVLPTIFLSLFFPFLFSRLLDPFFTALTSARGLEKRHRVPEAENNALPFPSD